MDGQVKKFLLLLLLLASPCFAQLSPQGNEQTVTYSGNTATVITSTSVNPNLLATTGTNTFIMGVTNPSYVARVYITNDTASSCNNLTLSFASTANTSLNSFNSTPSAWQTVQIVLSSGSVNSSPVTLAGNATATFTTAPILGNKLVMFLVLSSGCSSTNIDVRVIFGSVQIPNNSVQGPVPVGSSYTGFNPVICGMVDPNNLNQVFDCSAGYSGMANTNAPGLLIGAPNQGLPSTSGISYGEVTTPNGPAGGPMASFNLFENASAGGSTVPSLGTRTTNGNTNCSNANGIHTCGGLLIADTGMGTSATTFTIGPGPTSTVNYIAETAAGNSGVVSSCRFDVQTQFTGSGASTLDIYVQDSMEGAPPDLPASTGWNDRVHFTQQTNLTAATQFWYSSAIGPSSTAVSPAQYSNLALAAGTALNGPIAPNLRWVFVTTGATSQFIVNWGVLCK